MREIVFWRYYIPNIHGEGWGIFLLDSTGMFAAVTDYGNYAYRWTHTGCDDFREFFPCSGRYMLGKMAPSRGRHYEDERTIEDIKKTVLRLRRDNDLSEEEARKEWDLIGDNLEHEFGFYEWYQNTDLSDAGEYAVYDFTASEKAFADILLPRFYEAVKAELEAEKHLAEVTP